MSSCDLPGPQASWRWEALLLPGCLIVAIALSGCAVERFDIAGTDDSAVEAPVTDSARSPLQDVITSGSPDYQQLLPFDGIPPVYEPQFIPADQAPLQEDELVIGIAIDGMAKAYPITVLRFREMVNDELAGLPILVTW